jgi:predicted nucleic acid-binding protein
LSWEIAIDTPQAIVAALGIEARYKVSYRDTLILHAAASCVSCSEDSRGQRYGAVGVVNPLPDCSGSGPERGAFPHTALLYCLIL